MGCTKYTSPQTFSGCCFLGEEHSRSSQVKEVTPVWGVELGRHHQKLFLPSLSFLPFLSLGSQLQPRLQLASPTTATPGVQRPDGALALGQ